MRVYSDYDDDSGNGYINGRPMSFSNRPQSDRTDIFPGGLPRGSHKEIPHDHIVTNGDGGVEYMRENGEVINDYLG